jgi:protease-4
MAKRKDVIIAIIIGVSSIFAIGFFGLIFLSVMYSSDGDIFGGFGEKIAVIEVYGSIYESEDIIRQLKKWGESESIKAIILHIDSPGGAVAPSQEIYNEILRVRDEEGKIVVASTFNVAASGGYMVACAADKIMANPGTITGSIGVILQYPTAGGLFEKIGIKYETIKAGELKDVGALDRQMTKKEREMLTAMVMDTYEQFVDIVSESRMMERDYVYSLADGSVFSGFQAYQIGLVDTVGGFEDAVRLTAELAEISGEPEIVKAYKPQKGFFDFLGSLLGRANEISTGEFRCPRVMYLY